MATTLGLAILLCGLASCTDGLSCPSGFVHYENSCYHFSHDKQPWMLAQIICGEMGGYLTEIETQKEDSFLISEVNQLITDRFWIGGNDIQVEGEWVWWTSKNKVTGYTNWSPGNPSNSGRNENCMELHLDSTAYMWNDDACANAFNYICEISEDESVLVG